jgi:hypothetical protein
MAKYYTTCTSQYLSSSILEAITQSINVGDADPSSIIRPRTASPAINACQSQQHPDSSVSAQSTIMLFRVGISLGLILL